MTDDEKMILLCKAAKSMGMHFKGTHVDADDGFIGLHVNFGRNDRKFMWNPLVSSEHAFEVQVRKKMIVQVGSAKTRVTDEFGMLKVESWHRDHQNNFFVSTRHAITELAALMSEDH